MAIRRHSDIAVASVSGGPRAMAQVEGIVTGRKRRVLVVGVLAVIHFGLIGGWHALASAAWALVLYGVWCGIQEGMRQRRQGT